VTLANQFFEESRHDRDFGDITHIHRTEKVNVFSVNLDFEKTVDERQRLFYGAEGLLNKVGSTGKDENIDTGEAVPGSPRYPDGSTWNSYAAYISYMHKPVEKLTLQSGLRYNHVILDATFDNTFYPFPFTSAHLNDGALTGSIGTAYHPAESWQLNLNLSTGFRAPNIDDVGKVFDSEPGSVIVPNPNLEPEYVYNAEIGAGKTLGEVAKMDVTAYYMLLNNAMVRRDYTLNGMDSIMYDGELSQVQAIQNAAQAEVWGIQAAMEINLPLGFGLTSVFNFQKGEEELDDGTAAPLRHAAPWFGATHLTYIFIVFKQIYMEYTMGKLPLQNWRLQK
jgi:hemoglobin/transferrin/lactoferrin receptor protein